MEVQVKTPWEYGHELEKNASAQQVSGSIHSRIMFLPSISIMRRPFIPIRFTVRLKNVADNTKQRN